MNPLRHPRHLLGPLAAASLALVACGGGQTGAALPANPDVVVVAPGGLKFDKATYTAKAGDVGVEYDNNDVQTHTMIVENASGNKVPGWTRLVVGSQKKAGGTVTLQAGSYKIICDIHQAAGMVATLTVSP
jgi:plastocyanin